VEQLSHGTSFNTRPRTAAVYLVQTTGIGIMNGLAQTSARPLLTKRSSSVAAGLCVRNGVATVMGRLSAEAGCSSYYARCPLFPIPLSTFLLASVTGLGKKFGLIPTACI
jgi:hypothetical protein